MPFSSSLLASFFARARSRLALPTFFRCARLHLTTTMYYLGFSIVQRALQYSFSGRRRLVVLATLIARRRSLMFDHAVRFCTSLSMRAGHCICERVRVRERKLPTTQGFQNVLFWGVHSTFLFSTLTAGPEVHPSSETKKKNILNHKPKTEGQLYLLSTTTAATLSRI